MLLTLGEYIWKHYSNIKQLLQYLWKLLVFLLISFNNYGQNVYMGSFFYIS